MPRYELEFEAGFDDESPRRVVSAGQVKRVIFAGNKKIAGEMAKTMLWEPIAQSEFLYKLVGVRVVSDDVEYKPFWDLGGPGWANILVRMGLYPSDVDYVLEEDKERVFIVGFTLKKPEPKSRSQKR